MLFLSGKWEELGVGRIRTAIYKGYNIFTYSSRGCRKWIMEKYKTSINGFAELEMFYIFNTNVNVELRGNKQKTNLEHILWHFIMNSFIHTLTCRL